MSIKTIPLAKLLLGLLLVIVESLFLQSVATAELPAEDSKSPDQFVHDGVLISLNEPSLAIKVANKFEYVGRHSFVIRDVAAGERFIYVLSTDKLVEKLFMVQIEGFFPHLDNYYRYDLTESPMVAGYPFRSNGYAFNVADSIAANPGGESDETFQFLRSNGYLLPENFMMWRSLTVVDDNRKKEIILFYLEDMEPSGLKLADLHSDDTATIAWIEFQKGLEIRGNSSFRLTRLNDLNQPDSAAWMPIPNQFAN